MINSPFVVAGAPFILGLTNLGFMLALLFIAFATTLGLDQFGAKRMLPRLLIGALLVNFSVIIAGVMIDLSRLLMAIMVNVLTGGVSDVTLIGQSILRESPLLNNVFDISTFSDASFISPDPETSESWSGPLQVLKAVILIWSLVIGFLFIIVGLFIRYIALVMLLIIAPLPYLMIALPNMGGFAKKWWSLFLKYLLYGPIALFVLVLLVQASASLGNDITVGGTRHEASTVESIMEVFIMVAMLITAALAGSKLGGMGANGTMNFLQKRGKQAGAWAAKNPAKAGAIVGLAGGGIGAAATGLGVAGAKLATRRTAENARDAIRDTKSKVGDYARAGGFGTPGKVVAGVKRDDKGVPVKGQAGRSIGQSIAGSLTKGLKPPAVQKIQNDVKGSTAFQDARNEYAARRAAGETDKQAHDAARVMLNTPELSANNLRSGGASAAEANDVKVILEHGSQAKRKALFQDQAFVRSAMAKPSTDTDSIDGMMNKIENMSNDFINDKEREDVIDAIQKAVTKIQEGK